MLGLRKKCRETGKSQSTKSLTSYTLAARNLLRLETSLNSMGSIPTGMNHASCPHGLFRNPSRLRLVIWPLAPLLDMALMPSEQLLSSF